MAGDGWILGEVGDIEHDRELLRLLGGFDLFLQGKDRDLIVPDASKHKALWPILGRPGAILSGTEIVGTWRPKTAGKQFTLRLELWNNALEAEPQAAGPRSRAARRASRPGAGRDRRGLMSSFSLWPRLELPDHLIGRLVGAQAAPDRVAQPAGLGELAVGDLANQRRFDPMRIARILARHIDER